MLSDGLDGSVMCYARVLFRDIIVAQRVTCSVWCELCVGCWVLGVDAVKRMIAQKVTWLCTVLCCVFCTTFVCCALCGIIEAKRPLVS